MARKILLFLLLLPFACSKGLAQSRIYWIDSDSDQIRSVRLDGSDISTISRFGPIQGMTVDQEHGWIYYVDYPLGHGLYGDLRRLPLTGGSDEILVDVDFIDGGLAIDYVQDKIYMAVPFDLMHVTIVRTNLDGTELEKLAPDVSDRCHGIAVDQTGRYVYWTTGDSILRMGIQSGGVDDVTPDKLAEPYPISFDGGISIDEGARKMYWTQQGSRTSSSGMMKIFRANLDGSNVELAFQDYYSETGRILVDGQHHYMYWEQWPAYLAEDGLLIRRARTDGAIPINGGAVEDIVGPPETPSGLTKGIALFLDPGPAVPESPSNEAEDVATTTPLRWQAVRCSPRYDLQVASDSDFAQIVYRENTPHTSAEFVAPVAQHRYWWRVHSDACGIASHWSSPWWFDVGSTGPLAPNLLAPQKDGITGPAVTFSWSPGPDAVQHTLQVSTVGDFSTTVVDAESLTVAAFEVENLIAGQFYYWRVAGVDDEGRYTFSATRSFSVAAEPSAVNLIQPEDEETDVPPYTVFTWDAAEGADSYHFELSNGADFESVVVDTVVTATAYEMQAPLAFGSEYFWRVCGVNIAGEGPWSSRSFSVAGTPAALTLLTPGDGETEVPAYAVFTWEAAEGADSYHFELSNATDFASTVVDTVVTGTTYEMQFPLAYASEHYWRVCGFNTAGEGPWASRSFTVAVGTATEPTSGIPENTELGNPFPNPANGSVHFPIALASPEHVLLEVYDIFGRRVMIAANESLGAGRYNRRLALGGLASGTYVALLTAGTFESRRLFTVVR